MKQDQLSPAAPFGTIASIRGSAILSISVLVISVQICAILREDEHTNQLRVSLQQIQSPRWFTERMQIRTSDKGERREADAEMQGWKTDQMWGVNSTSSKMPFYLSCMHFYGQIQQDAFLCFY